ncbi:Aldo-keto reductase family 1 member C18-like [Homarus americanus]|uniref:Aldo-keto reductase family 1 member C18-like n=1 Tax=Homarus americanus TaxID=6706 RepID=A0A8J5N7K4_HOMAM|nr:Aldo-keto reductase family 1 member C18-like [Homarus americanus]
MIGNRKCDVEKFMKKSLKNLGLEYVDAYFIESPVGLRGSSDKDVQPRDEHGNSVLDLTTDLRSLWEGMEEQLEAGRTRFIGLCNFNIKQVERIVSYARHPPTFVQMDINVYNMRREERRRLREMFITPIATDVLGNQNFITKKKYPLLWENKVVLHLAKKCRMNPLSIIVGFVLRMKIICLLRGFNTKMQEIIYTDLKYFYLHETSIRSLQDLDLKGNSRLKNFVTYKGKKKKKAKNINWEEPVVFPRKLRVDYDSDDDNSRVSTAPLYIHNPVKGPQNFLTGMLDEAEGFCTSQFADKLTSNRNRNAFSDGVMSGIAKVDDRNKQMVIKGRIHLSLDHRGNTLETRHISYCGNFTTSLQRIGDFSSQNTCEAHDTHLNDVKEEDMPKDTKHDEVPKYKLKDVHCYSEEHTQEDILPDKKKTYVLKEGSPQEENLKSEIKN